MTYASRTPMIRDERQLGIDSIALIGFNTSVNWLSG